MTPSWVSQYTAAALYPGPLKDGGRDPEGWDSYGLVYWCKKTHQGEIIPAYDEGCYQGVSQYRKISKLIRNGLADWQEVAVEKAQLFDAILLRFRNRPLHIGLVIEPGWMLHADHDIDTVYERYDVWHEQILGVWRYAG